MRQNELITVAFTVTLIVEFVATVVKMMFLKVVQQCILPWHPIPRHAPCVSEISVGKPVKHVSSHQTPLYFASTHERLEAYKTCVVAIAPAVSLCVCFVRTCHIEMKIHVCSQALSDKAHLHGTIVHDDMNHS